MITEIENGVRVNGCKMVIMVVDDDANNLAVVRDCLTGFNYTVLVAEDGESAILRADYARPDLILLDIMMPGMDGYETCRRLKLQESSRDIPVIFMSALAETGQKVRGLEAGAVDYVTKPFHQEELLARVEVHLSIRDLNRRLKEANELLESRVEERTRELAIANLELKNEITERMATQEQLRQSQKMEAIGTLAGGVAHDFNNILTVIMGFSTLLLEKLEEKASLQGYVDEILAAAAKAAKLTRSLLTFSRKQIMETRQEELNEIVKTSEQFLRRVIGENIKLVCSYAPAEMMIMGDSVQIEQVLMNLAVNARDAMPNGGVLSIKTEYLELTEEMLHASLKPGPYARITVSDTGCGIDEATLQRIYEPFFTTKEIGKGTGLGLSIVYGIIKQHKGEVTVESKIGKGSSFMIYLPLISEYKTDYENESISQVVGGTETILLAEDDDAVRNFMVQSLKDYGYQVIEALDGQDALTKYRANKDRIHLVLLDVVMPKMNGRDVCDVIRKDGGQTRIIFSSGYTADIIEQKVLAEEGICFMAKPVTVQVLLSKVREALNQA